MNQNNFNSNYLALNNLPKSTQTVFNYKYNQKIGKKNNIEVTNKPYFIGSPMSKNIIRNPLLNSGNGIGAPFEYITNTEIINSSYIYDIENFFNIQSYNNEDIYNFTGISNNIDNVYNLVNTLDVYKYPSNMFFEIPDTWLFADMYTTDITFNNLLGNKIISLSTNTRMKALPSKGQNSDFLNIEKNIYQSVSNVDMLYAYSSDYGSNINETIYKNLKSDKIFNNNDYFSWEKLGGIIYDFGWWYRITQIGVNSLFYPQYNTTIDQSKKYPIFNLSSIVQSILNFNNKYYQKDLINPVALCLVDVGDYSDLNYGPINNSYCGKDKCNVFDNNKCSKGNVNVYIKTSRTNPNTGNSNSKWWNYSYFNANGILQDKMGLLETGYPPFYGGYELITAIEGKLPSDYYDENKKLIVKPSKKYYVIKENQFAICPQVPYPVFNSQISNYINSIFTVYILNYSFFKNNLNNSPWWTFTKYYKIINVDLSDFTLSNNSVGSSNIFDTSSFNSLVEDIISPSIPSDNQVRNLNKYFRIRYKPVSKNKNDVYYLDSFNLTKELQKIEYNNIFKDYETNNDLVEAMIIYPSSLILLETFSRISPDNNNEYITEGYSIKDSPSIIRRIPLNIEGFSPQYYLRLRSNTGINYKSYNVIKTPNTISKLKWSSNLNPYYIYSAGTSKSTIKFNTQ